MNLELTSYKARLLVLGLMISAAFAHPSLAEQAPPAPENDPLYMRVIASTWPSEGAILVGNGGKHSAYELYVTNLGKTPLKIVELTVQGKKNDEVVMDPVLDRQATGRDVHAGRRRWQQAKRFDSAAE